jgi:hypothetical protein
MVFYVIYVRHLGMYYIERSIEFVIKVGAGTEAVGLFESIHLFVYKLMLQNSISGVKRRACLCLEQNNNNNNNNIVFIR